MADTPRRRLILILSENAYQEFGAISASCGMNKAELLRYGINLAKLISEVQGRGNKFIEVDDQGRVVQECILPMRRLPKRVVSFN